MLFATLSNRAERGAMKKVAMLISAAQAVVPPSYAQLMPGPINPPGSSFSYPRASYASMKSDVPAEPQPPALPPAASLELASDDDRASIRSLLRPMESCLRQILLCLLKDSSSGFVVDCIRKSRQPCGEGWQRILATPDWRSVWARAGSRHECDRNQSANARRRRTDVQRTPRLGSRLVGKGRRAWLHADRSAGAAVVPLRLLPAQKTA